MKKPSSPEAFIAAAPEERRTRLVELREIMLTYSELSEAIKWAFPVYTLGKKNVAGIFHTKTYVGVWFPQGALLSDPNSRLVNASPGKTVAQRQLRFGADEPVDSELVHAFMVETIQNQKMGLELRPANTQGSPPPAMPNLLREALAADELLADAYAKFPPYKQREFCESITEAKREATKLRRLEKALRFIREGRGLSDQYRK